jgi:p-hydroxybenzoate 3-monooxygenase
VSADAPAETQVGIVGAGPAGLVLGLLLRRSGIDSVVLEARDRNYVEQRVRAGVLEQGTVDLLLELGVGERLEREGLVHHGIELRFDGRGHRIPFDELTGGNGITIYGQQEVVKDLIADRLEHGEPLLFEAEATGLAGLDGDRPSIRYRHRGDEAVLRCEFVAGCDGFHGECRAAVPDGAIHVRQHEYPFAWLGILADVAPSTEELIYAKHDRGFALHSMRSPELSRLYVQSDAADGLEDWPDERIWEELHVRLRREDGWELAEGPIVEKGITPLRSFVAEPMQYGRLYLAGDAVHIVPATGAKGLNLAVADVIVLADALSAWFAQGDADRLARYTATCLTRVWRAQHFASWMTRMLHRYPDQDDFEAALQSSELEYIAGSRAAATVLAENYVGLEWPATGHEAFATTSSQRA